MNRVQLIGRLTKDIDLRRTQSGKAVTSFFLAVDRWKKDEGADFISCVAWGTTAEAMSRFLSKGSKIAVCGRLAVRSYEKDGCKTYITEVIADEVNFLESRRDEPVGQEETFSDNVLSDVDDDDLPF